MDSGAAASLVMALGAIGACAIAASLGVAWLYRRSIESDVAIRAGWVDYCQQCDAPVIAPDDAGLVCAHCGGRNRRVFL